MLVYPGVVDDEIHITQLRLDIFLHGQHVFFFRDVTFEKFCAYTDVTYLPEGLVCHFPVGDINSRDVSPVPCQPERNAPSDAPGGSGDQGDLAFEIVRHLNT